MPLVPTATPDAEKLTRLLQERGWTMTYLARRIGRNPGSIWNIANGKENVSVKFIRQMARELGVRTIDISDWDDHEDAPAEALAS